jgi:hypothetical protein
MARTDTSKLLVCLCFGLSISLFIGVAVVPLQSCIARALLNFNEKNPVGINCLPAGSSSTNEQQLQEGLGKDLRALFDEGQADIKTVRVHGNQASLQPLEEELEFGSGHYVPVGCGGIGILENDVGARAAAGCGEVSYPGFEYHVVTRSLAFGDGLSPRQSINSNAVEATPVSRPGGGHVRVPEKELPGLVGVDVDIMHGSRSVWTAACRSLFDRLLPAGKFKLRLFTGKQSSAGQVLGAHLKFFPGQSLFGARQFAAVTTSDGQVQDSIHSRL